MIDYLRKLQDHPPLLLQRLCLSLSRVLRNSLSNSTATRIVLQALRIIMRSNKYRDRLIEEDLQDPVFFALDCYTDSVDIQIQGLGALCNSLSLDDPKQRKSLLESGRISILFQIFTKFSESEDVIYQLVTTLLNLSGTGVDTKEDQACRQLMKDCNVIPRLLESINKFPRNYLIQKQSLRILQNLGLEDLLAEFATQSNVELLLQTWKKDLSLLFSQRQRVEYLATLCFLLKPYFDSPEHSAQQICFLQAGAVDLFKQSLMESANNQHKSLEWLKASLKTVTTRALRWESDTEMGI